MRDDPEWPDDSPEEGREQDSIGSIFHRARQEAGYDLDMVAGELRIRRPYLEAIEEGRYQDLPGTAYAIGFVRSYAEYLGLDSEGSVALFKSEISELARARQELKFPAPKPEGRLPGAALIVISLLIVALAYGGWYYWTQSDRPYVELLPPPEDDESLQLAEGTVDDRAPSPEPSVDEPAGAQGPELPELPEPEGEAEALGEAAAPLEGGQQQEAVDDAAAKDPETPAAESSATGGAANGSSADADVLPPTREEDAASGDDGAAEPSGAFEAADEAAADASAAGAQPDAGEEKPAVAFIDMDDLGAGQRYGEEGPVSVVLLATADSWIQVRGAGDELLFTRVLRPGDTYRVPGQSGLTLLTGNAGGLDVVVEGQRLPPLGPNGAVRRDIPLDPEALRAWKRD